MERKSKRECVKGSRSLGRLEALVGARHNRMQEGGVKLCIIQYIVVKMSEE